MTYDANVLNIHDNKNHIPTLADAAEKLIICADDIPEIAKSFVHSSNSEKRIPAGLCFLRFNFN